MPPKRRKTAKMQGAKKTKVASKELSPRSLIKEEESEERQDDKLGEDMEESRGENDHNSEYVNEDQGVVLSIAKKKKIIPCKQCSKKFTFKASYEKHLKMEHSTLPGSVKCDKCAVRCPNKTALKEHVEKFHDRDIYECPQCKKTFVRTAHVLRHMAQTGCDGSKAANYPCEICGARFRRKDNLMVHLRMQHIMRKQYCCKVCSFSTATFSKLCVHMNKFHSGEKKQKYECDHCGKVVTSRPAMCKHLEIHGEKKYACDVCGYNTFTIEVMRRHVLTHVEDKPYKCEQCGQSFIQRSQLQRHQEKHDNYTCLVCDKIMPNKSQLSQHMKQEHKLTSADMMCFLKNCPQFGKPYSSKHLWNEHMKSHLSGDRPYACDVCGRSYRNVVDMRRHVSSHALERPRRCMYCVQARAYVRGMQLVKHVRKAHPAVFGEHLAHVREVLGAEVKVARVKQSELDAILNVLDAEADRILEGYGEGVLYGGMQDAPDQPHAPVDDHDHPTQSEDSPLMSERELEASLRMLLEQLIDKELLECFGWPTENIDTVLEKVIVHCGAKGADRAKWTRVQCLRENTKHLFLHVIEDKNITRMLHSHTVDQIVKHILAQVAETVVVVEDADDDEDVDTKQHVVTDTKQIVEVNDDTIVIQQL